MKDFKKIYKRFLRDSSTNLLFSSTLTVGVFLIYLIGVLFFVNGGGSAIMNNIFGLIIVIAFGAMIIGLLSPFIYSFFACNGVLNTNKRNDVKYTSFLKTYMIGTRAPFNGQLRIWNTLLISFLIYFILNTFAYVILVAVAQNEGSPFKAYFDELNAIDILSPNYYGEVGIINAKYDSLIRSSLLITQFISLFISTYYFIHTIAKNTIRFFLAPALLNAPNRLVTYVYKQTMRKYKSDYRKKYYGALWPLTLLFVVSFSLTFFLLGYLMPVSMNQALLGLTSILVSLIVLLPFLPVLFNFHETIWPKYSIYFLDYFLTSASNEIHAMKENLESNRNVNLSGLDNAERNLNKIKESFDKQKDSMMNDIDKENNESKKDDNDSSKNDKKE